MIRTVQIKLRTRDSSHSYVEVVFNTTLNQDISEESLRRMTEMLWNVERAINETGRVRAWIEVSEAQ